MRSFIVAAVSLLAVGSYAAPTEISSISSLEKRGSCMPYSVANELANAFKDLINLPFNKTLAIHAMTPTFQDFSDSVNELINQGCPNGPQPLTQATFTSRAAFIKGQSGQAPIPFEILKIYSNCNSVTIRWRTSAPGTVQPEEPVSGIIVLETVPNTVNPSGEFSWKIQTTYSEFNSGAWLYDLGVFVPSCS